MYVSKHALVRYLERIKGLSFNQASQEVDRRYEVIRKEVIPPSMEKRIDKFGDGDYPRNGYIVRVRSNTAVTVFPDLPNTFFQEGDFSRSMKRSRR